MKLLFEAAPGLYLVLLPDLTTAAWAAGQLARRVRPLAKSA
ncbi:MAG TPA: hypothetical protein VK932_14300 [Kofleriaceae bacterium]|nr:hypothetical protein [Kofleriaceae bacterium]